MGRQFMGQQVNFAADDFDSKDGGAAAIGIVCLTITKANGPIVQRTSHLLTEHNPLRQWAAFVRTPIEQGKHLILCVSEQSHIQALVALDSSCAQYRDVLKMANFFPHDRHT
jgi:hypothetical protein